MKRGELKSMKLFKNLFKENNEITLASPVDGKLVSIKTVSDPTFSEEIIGKSVAIMPSEGLLVLQHLRYFILFSALQSQNGI